MKIAACLDSPVAEVYQDAMLSVSECIRGERLGGMRLRSPVTVPTGTPANEAVQRMQDGATGCVLVLDGARLAGIFTERDVLTRIAGTPAPNGRRVDDVMTAAPVTLSPEASLADAVDLMTTRGFRHVPVVAADGSVAGVLSAEDVVDFLVEHFPNEVYNLPPRLHQPMRAPDGG